jgi:hypothetical protein
VRTARRLALDLAHDLLPCTGIAVRVIKVQCLMSARRLTETAAASLATAAIALVGVPPAWGQTPTPGDPAASAPVVHQAGFETGTFSEFDAPDILHGTLVTTQERAFDGAWAAKGSLDGSPRNGFSRVVWSVAYEPAQTIRYGASYFLPGPLPCWATLARWDNYLLYEGEGDVGGVELEDGVIRLVRSNYDGANYARLTPSAPVPIGRWFTIEVVQRVGVSDAYNALYLDGSLVGSSTAPNSRGRPIRHIRFGYVSDFPECAPASSFYIDNVFAS